MPMLTRPHIGRVILFALHQRQPYEIAAIQAYVRIMHGNLSMGIIKFSVLARQLLFHYVELQGCKCSRVHLNQYPAGELYMLDDNRGLQKLHRPVPQIRTVLDKQLAG
jgi:hypothetical protein